MTSNAAAMGAATDELAEQITRIGHDHHPMDADYPSLCYRCTQLYPCEPVKELMAEVMLEGLDKLDQLGILDVITKNRRARRKR